VERLDDRIGREGTRTRERRLAHRAKPPRIGQQRADSPADAFR
jgi:hypothetical protein